MKGVRGSKNNRVHAYITDGLRSSQGGQEFYEQASKQICNYSLAPVGCNAKLASMRIGSLHFSNVLFVRKIFYVLDISLYGLHTYGTSSILHTAIQF